MAYASWSVIAGETPTASKWNILGTNDADFDSRVGQLEDDKVLESNTDGTTITFNLSKSKIHTVVLGGNRTLALSNVSIGQAFCVRLVQPAASAGKTVTWWSGIKWPYDVTPVLSTGVNDIDTFVFICTASGAYDGYIAGQGL